MDSSTARGLLMLRPIPTTPPTDSDTPDLDTPDTSDTPDMVDTTTESRLHQDLFQQLKFRQKWIIISLKFPSPVLQFQCYHTKSLVMVAGSKRIKVVKIQQIYKKLKNKKK